MNYWTWYLLAAGILFAGREFTALATGHAEKTLSVYLWKKFGVVRGQPISKWSFKHFAFAGLFAFVATWLIGHFGWGIWA